MNSMLASVLERTREVGLRRGVGATRRDIRAQFVVEALAIAVVGGLVGVVMGVVIARVIASFAGWPTVVMAFSVMLSPGVSMAAGLAGGIDPAVRAASLDPIEALRARVETLLDRLPGWCASGARCWAPHEDRGGADVSAE